MKVLRRAAACCLLVAAGAAAALAAKHDTQGLVLQTDRAHNAIVVSCDDIPGYMPAMEMRFAVADREVFRWLRPGTTIRFTLDDSGKEPVARGIQTVVNFEPEPTEAGALTALGAAVGPQKSTKPLEVGEQVPDFALTDQAGATVRLSDLRGKVVALTFGYSRCPFPTYCLRLSKNLQQVEERFRAQAGRDLVLITIAIDPEYDSGPVLSEYARSFNADPARWHFLTGQVADIRAVAGEFGMNFWRTEGLLTHTLRTVVIDRQGRLAGNLDGNRYKAQQLGDLVEMVMNRRD